MSIDNIPDLSAAAKRALLRDLILRKRGQTEGLIPLSSGQKSLWFVHQTAPESPAYNFAYAARVRVEVDAEALRRAFVALAGRHPLLRATVEVVGLKPYLRVRDRAEIPWRTVDSSGLGPEALLAAIREEAGRPFDLQATPPIRVDLHRVGPGESVLALSGHHILADLWSLDVMLEELRALYAAEVRGTAHALPAPGASFADFVRWQSLLVAGSEGRRDWDYWSGKLSGDLPPLELVPDRRRPAVQTFRGLAHSWTPDPAVMRGFRDLAGAEKTTPFTALLAAFQVLLHRYTGQSDIILGTATAGRDRPEWERVVGYFLNQVALRVEVSGSEGFLGLLGRARVAVLEALEHASFPFGLLVERLQPGRDAGRSPVVQAVFIWDKPRVAAGPGGASGPGALPLETLLMEQCGAPFDLALVFVEDGPGLTAHLRYNADLFDGATIARMAGHLDVLWAAIVADPTRRVGDLPLLTEADRRRLGQGPGRSPWKAGRPGHRLVEEQARRTPEATALIATEGSLTYREMERRANQLARHLIGLGVGPGSVVGLCVPRSCELILSILATWKAGAAYVALDPAYPDARLGAMVEAARPAVVLTFESLGDRMGQFGVPVARLDSARAVIDGEGETPPDMEVGPDDLAYLIFTSGSTGRPKGVMLAHRGLGPLVEASREVYGFGEGDRVLQFASPCFDASVFEILSALTSGSALVLAPPSALLLGETLLAILRERRVTAVTLPPSILSLLPDGPLPDLRIINVAGEACPAGLVGRWAPGRQFFNAYGPTEATVWATVATCSPDGRAPTIGVPIAGFRAYVLDGARRPVPSGVPGELHLAGPGLALGYLDAPELTAASFVPDPFDVRGEGVMYRTGDLVRARADGELEYLGRLDHQVKIRGHRIDPSEVEAVLLGHPAVRGAVVVARGADDPSTCTLVAYAAFDRPEAAPLDEVRAYLRGRLPYHLLPAGLVPLAALPLTSNGKVDREALPAFAPSKLGPKAGLTPPRDEVERRLAAIYARVLDLDEVGVHDNFFDLGGASLQTLQVVALAGEAGLRLTPERLFQYQTVAELAASLASAPEMGAAPAPIPAVVPAAPAVAAPKAQGAVSMVIEGLGVYLPPDSVSTAELVAGCRVPLAFPLERMTGIRSRRMAGKSEFSLDLARKAVADCFGRSRHGPEAIDLLICCNISRCDGPGHRFSFEPSTASRLQGAFGMAHALAFDVSNACAGTFTAFTLAEAYLRTGAARRVMVVSGEYISHLSATAQREITDFVDSRIACLTLGDSGVAAILEASPSEAVGFHDLDLFTLGKHSDLCVAKLTDQPHGGAIMVTDAVRSSAVTIHQAVAHALGTLRRRGWDPGSIDHLMMHQTSETTLDGAVREINKAAGRTVCHRGNTVYNLAERGNTATNSHLVALMDNIRAGVIQPGARVVFGVSGSGQTVGTATYTLDDLPDRLRRPANPPAAGRSPRAPWAPPEAGPRVRIEAVGTVPEGDTSNDSVALIRRAGGECLAASRHPKGSIGLVIHSGVYRTEFLSEPALAAIAAGALEINHDGEAVGERTTLAFDLLNGAVGTLDACHVATRMIAAGRSPNALILASEVENNPEGGDEPPVGVKPTASALVLELSDDGEGFGPFLFRSFPEHADADASHTAFRDGRTAMRHERLDSFEPDLLRSIRATVDELLEAQGVEPGRLALVLPPHGSAGFVARLAGALDLPASTFVALPDEARDYFTSSLAFAFRAARDGGRVKPGDVALIIAAGSGIQVGCCLYHFA